MNKTQKSVIVTDEESEETDSPTSSASVVVTSTPSTSTTFPTNANTPVGKTFTQASLTHYILTRKPKRKLIRY